MDRRLFDKEVGDLTTALGDATRRGIYVSVREAKEPVTASQTAELFGLHTNVARHHLDHLVADGYLDVSHHRRSGKRGPGAGRPAKHYRATVKEVSVQFPARRHDLLSELLARVIERLAPESAAAVAEEVGREYGRELAKEIGLPQDAGFETAVHAVAQAMLGVGFGIEARAPSRELITYHCPFGATATDHPEIVCKLDQGLVTGLLEATQQKAAPLVIPHHDPNEACVTKVRGLTAPSAR